MTAQDDVLQTGTEPSLSVSLEDAAATERFGERLAACLPRGAVVALDGPLGAGKTTLVRGLARGLGCADDIASPTFTLMTEHEGCGNGLIFYHLDVYRLDQAEEFQQAGLDECFTADGICAIEWASRLGALLPDGTIRLTLYIHDNSTSRRLCVVWPNGDAPIRQLSQMLSREGF